MNYRFPIKCVPKYVMPFGSLMSFDEKSAMLRLDRFVSPRSNHQNCCNGRKYRLGKLWIAEWQQWGNKRVRSGWKGWGNLPIFASRLDWFVFDDVNRLKCRLNRRRRRRRRRRRLRRLKPMRKKWWKLKLERAKFFSFELILAAEIKLELCLLGNVFEPWLRP